MKTSTILLLAGAGLLVAHQMTKPSPVSGDMLPGMGGFGKKLKKAVKKAGGGISKGINQGVRIVKQAPAVVKQVGQTAAAVAQKYDPGTKLVTKIAQKTVKNMPKFVRKVPLSIGGKKISGSSGSPGVPAPAQEIEYQDENGNVISAAEYARRVAEQERLAREAAQRPQAPQVLPQPQPQVPSYPQYVPPSSGGGGSGWSEESLLPPTTTSKPTPSVVDAAAPAAASKMNPLLTIAAFVGVPVVMALTGEK